MAKKKRVRNLDHPWKDTMEDLFPWMIRFCNPKLYGMIDWSKGYTFLDKELRQIMPRSDKRERRYVDKLAQVTFLSGDVSDLYMHVEFQGDKEHDFGFRMFTYYYRLMDHLGRNIYSLAILGDTSTEWKPSPFKHQVLNCKLRFDFPVIKLSDYKDKWDQLEKSRNPFALVVMAHIKASQVADNLAERARWKRHFMRLALTRGYKPHDILAILRYLEWVMRLPKALDRKLERELDKELGGGTMALRTRWEREAEKRGKKLGEEAGEAKALTAALLTLMQQKFGDLPAWAKDKLSHAELPTLKTWVEAVFPSKNIEAVFAAQPE